MTRVRRFGGAAAVVLLLGTAFVIVQWQPWHGPIILTLSTAHGIHMGDLLALPLVALAVALVQSRMRHRPRPAAWPAGRWSLPASAVLLGALLLLAPVDETTRHEPLLASGGGTFDGGEPEHADARRPCPANRWSHLALTYDGRSLRLYVNGIQVSSRAVAGGILKTDNPLWIGGNHPYGEYFRGVIDEVRVYDRVLPASEVRREMSTPIASSQTARVRGLVAAYAFNRRSGSLARDASGHGNTGKIIKATWTTRGRFGGALRFDGDDETVRIPASPSLALRHAMTLSSWSRPQGSQGGWRTILHRQTDAYFLDAGGGTYQALGAVDDARAALLVAAAIWFCLMLAGSGGRRVGGRAWWPPVTLFLAGSVMDAALAPTITLLGPAFVAGWFALTAPRRGEALLWYGVTALLTVITLVSVAGASAIDLSRDDGGVARSVALGVLFLIAGLLGTRYGSRAFGRSAP